MIAALVVVGGLIGLTLGALGAGGSILAVPVLAHVAGLPATAATATSLVAVGSSALFAATGHRRRVRLDVAAWFVPTGVVGAFVGAAVGRCLDDAVVLLAFSALMVVAAWRMFGPPHRSAGALSAAVDGLAAPCPERPPVLAGRCRGIGRSRGRSAMAAAPARASRRTSEVVTIVVAGTAVGFLTGLFGVGGGFVVVPALTLAVGLAMPHAVATSLVIVAANAAIALALRGTGDVDWSIALALSVPMLAGSVAGARLAHGLDADRTRRAFAALLIAVAAANAIAVLA